MAKELDENVKPLSEEEFSKLYKEACRLKKIIKEEEELKKIKMEENKSGFNVIQAHWFDIGAKIVGTAASLSLFCSIIYDWGYFKAFGLSFSDFPSSINDHLRATLAWFPGILVMMGGGLILELITRRLEQGMTEEEILQTTANPEKTKKFRERPFKLLPYTALLMLVAYVLLGDMAISGLPLALLILWFPFAIWLNNHPRILKRRNRLLMFAIYVIPTVVILFASIGYVKGKSIILSNKPLYMLRLKGTKQEDISAMVVRFFEKGALLKYPKKNEFFFLKWEEIEKITLEKDDLIYHGLLPMLVDLKAEQKIVQ